MAWLPALVLLLVTALAVHPLVGLAWPEVTKPWSMGWILLWVLWGSVVVPLIITGWSNFLSARTARRLGAQLTAWKDRGAPADATLTALLREALEADQRALIDEVLRALAPRRRDDARLEALCEAGQAWLAAAGFGSGAFHADGWASLSLQERRDAFAALVRKA